MCTCRITGDRVEATVSESVEIRPQSGRQEQFLASPADIAIYGGAAGGGKTWALLLEPLRHIDNADFGAVFFRRTIPEITAEGGIWDEASNLYSMMGAAPNQNEHFYQFPSGARCKFSHLQYDADLDSWKSAQIALLLFDQLETFTKKQFFYMFSRNRSLCGVRPYIRATANPQPGWLAEFLSWWIAEDGFADLSRVGKLRWFIRNGDQIVWGDSREELVEKYHNPDLPENDPKQPRPKSVTFIVSTVFDNKILLERNPDYLANLQALDYVDQQRLLGDPKRGGNWKIQPSAGNIFNRKWYEIVDAVPDAGSDVRFWDLAATEGELTAKTGPARTASVRMKLLSGVFYVMHCTEELLSPAMADEAMQTLAELDGKNVKIRWEMEGGSAGKRDAVHIAKLLAGYDAIGRKPMGDKFVRAKSLAAQSFAGNVKLLRGAWNEAWLTHMHGQPDYPWKDIMDASSGAFNELSDKRTVGAWGRRAS